MITRTNRTSRRHGAPHALEAFRVHDDTICGTTVVRVTDSTAKAAFLEAFVKANAKKEQYPIPLICKKLREAPELLFWVPVAHSAVLHDAKQAGTNAGGVLGFDGTRRGISVAGILSSKFVRGKASVLVTALKQMAAQRNATIHVDSPPCLSRVSARFWIKNGFNPSDELLRQKALYDGRFETIKTTLEINLTWSNGDDADDAISERRRAAMDRFHLW